MRKKMKMKMKVFAVIIAAIMTAGSFVLSSCHKEDMASNYSIKESTSVIDEESPFDYIGMSHNEALYQIGSYLSADFNNFVMLQHKTSESRDSLIEKIIAIAPSIIVSSGLTELSENDVEEIIDATIFTAEGDGVVTSEVADSIGRIFSEYEGIEDLDELQTLIRNYELSKINNEMSAIDSQIVICLNIYYHSLNFWKDATFNVNNPWYQLIDDINNNPNDYSFSTAKELNIRNWVQKAGNWLHNTYQHIKEKYTWKNVGAADLYGAAAGCSLIIYTGGNSVWISAAAMSAIGPLFM